MDAFKDCIKERQCCLGFWDCESVSLKLSLLWLDSGLHNYTIQLLFESSLSDHEMNFDLHSKWLMHKKSSDHAKCLSVFIWSGSSVAMLHGQTVLSVIKPSNHHINNLKKKSTNHGFNIGFQLISFKVDKVIITFWVLQFDSSVTCIDLHLIKS